MYHSYLLRLWRSSQSNAVWRASLESAQSGERRGFADLESLFVFLEAQTALMVEPTIARRSASRDGDIGSERK
jgi:hypothetical protein